jgi:hypothetical protein
VTAPPEGLTLQRHRDFEGLEKRPVARWIALGVVVLFLLLGLLNLFGQRPDTAVAATDGVELEVYSPTKVRSGIYFMSRFTIAADREVEAATLVLDPGWLEGMTLNSLEPGPIGEANRDGRLALELGRIPAGSRHVFFLHFQVNPTNVGRRSQDVDLLDGDRLLVHVDRTITIYP